jgi:D-sedoheptulose 7-phosphate isomerase
MSDSFFDRYFGRLALCIAQAPSGDLERVAELLRVTRERKGRIFIAGNGGSAAIASHAAIDFTKAAGITAECFNEAALITCFANDYGYEHWLERALDFHGKNGDVAVLISSSGRSPNMLNAAKKAREKGMKLVTLSGFSPDNPLRAEGEINLWVDSTSYNMVENTHQVWLLAVCDRLAGANPAL